MFFFPIFSDSEVCRYVSESCMLILQFLTLSKLFTSSNSFMAASLGCYLCKSRSPTNRDNLEAATTSARTSISKTDMLRNGTHVLHRLLAELLSILLSKTLKARTTLWPRKPMSVYKHQRDEIKIPKDYLTALLFTKAKVRTSLCTQQRRDNKNITGSTSTECCPA